MLAAVDVAYGDRGAAAACLVFERWTSGRATEVEIARVDEVAPYVPGSFYERELPPILRVLAKVDVPLEAIVIDGYVMLGPDRPGLGAHLHRALSGEVAVVGVAKTPFRHAPAVPVLRGSSVRPLFVTAVGIDVEVAAHHLRAMHGNARIPTLLREVDRRARRALQG